MFADEDDCLYNPSMALRALMRGKISMMGKRWSGRGRQEEQEKAYPKAESERENEGI